MFFSLASNILVVSSILIGGAAAISSLTGMSVYASLWLLPLSVSAYTLRGGLRATILTDYVSFVLLLMIKVTVSILVGSYRHHFDHHPHLLVQSIRIWESDRITRQDVGPPHRSRKAEQLLSTHQRRELPHNSISGCAEVCHLKYS